jgi:hypothetical protein
LHLGTEQYSRTPDFLEWKIENRRRKKTKREQLIRKIKQARWDRLKMPAAWKAYFRCIASFPDRPWLDRFEFRRPWYFTLKVAPHMVDTVFVRDSAVDRRIREFRSWIRNHGLEYRWQRIRDESPWKVPNTRRKVLAKLHQSEMQASLGPRHETDVGTLQKRFHICLRVLVLFPA